MEQEVYILNDEQVEWFQNRYLQTELAQIVVIKTPQGDRCVEKKYLTEELFQDVIDYIAEQQIPVSLVNLGAPSVTTN